MKKEFKKGDKVMKIDGSRFFTGKKVHTIRKAETNGIACFEESKGWMPSEKLVKIEELLKVGDKVSKLNGYTFSDGNMVQTIKDIKENNVWFEESGTYLSKDDIYLVEKAKIEKNYREVVRDIKCGETWRSKFKVITCDDNGNISVSDTSFEMKTRTMLFDLETLYTKDKEQITFEEAIKLHKTGSIIESALTGNTYQRVTTGGEEYIKVQVEEILNGWYLYE